MKKLFLLLGLLALTSCAEQNVVPTGDVVTEAPSDSERYVLFTVNTQEFVYSEQSAETLNRLLDIHEQYEVPVDVYLTEDILRTYEEMAPDLVERLKTSPVVAVSYHYRPPAPFHNSAYDFLGLEDMTSEGLYSALLHYEEYATDPETGATTKEEGGYQHVKDVIGYAPVVVGMAVGDRAVGDALGQIYKEKGATFAVSHDGVIALGDEQFGLFLRPEDIEVKLFELTGQDAEALISGLWGEQGEQGFMNIKVHDNDFIATASAWVSIYLKQKPPYDVDRGTTERELLTEAETAPLWELYEASVKYVSEHASQYQAINAFDLQKMLPTQP